MKRFADCSIDDETVSLARKGDLAAHELIYRAYSDAVYNLALRITYQTVVADEILQETFVAVLTRIETFRGEAKLGTWIREIAVNNCLMYLRSGWYSKSCQLEPMETGPVDGPDMESIADHMDLEKALGRLPDISRTVVWLHDVEGYTHHEIGKLMGKTTSFSKSQLARAHKRLHAMLYKDNESEQCMQLSNNY